MDEQTLQQLFTKARSHNGWQNRTVSDEQVGQIYDLMKFGPTSANCCPLRMIFIKSDVAKMRLKPYLDEGNVEKAMTAPMVVVFTYDTEFYEQLPYLFPHADARSWFVGNADKITQAGQFNATLQIGYFILAARVIGLDCGPMVGFSKEGVDNEFFSDGKQKSLLICGIGYGDISKLFPRSPRLDFNQTCNII